MNSINKRYINTRGISNKLNKNINPPGGGLIVNKILSNKSSKKSLSVANKSIDKKLSTNISYKDSVFIGNINTKNL